MKTIDVPFTHRVFGAQDPDEKKKTKDKRRFCSGPHNGAFTDKRRAISHCMSILWAWFGVDWFGFTVPPKLSSGPTPDSTWKNRGPRLLVAGGSRSQFCHKDTHGDHTFDLSHAVTERDKHGTRCNALCWFPLACISFRQFPFTSEST